MADSKQYELIFLLRAQMDASLKQFSLVGGQIKELEQKIQQYNNTLKDIGAYKQQTAAINDYGQKLKQQEATLAEVTQKFNEATAAVKTAEQAYRQHQTAIDSLNLKIAEVKARIAELNAAMKQDGADTKALAQQKAECSAQLAKYNLQLQKEKQALQETKQKLNENRAAERELLEQKNQSQAAMDRLREKLAQEREKLTDLSEALKKAGVDTKNLEEAEKSLAKQIQEATDEQERITEFANRVNDLADKFTVLKMAASGVQSAIRPVMDFFKDSLDAAAKLEYGMSSVQAVSGATAAETKQLTAVVKEMGATTIYTAEQSAQAMQNMALAGWDAQQMISGLPAVIKLAAAAGEDLAEMTSIVSDGMNAFQLSGEAAAVKFADVLAKAATSSNTNVSLLGQSLSYVETTAGNLGYSIEDVSLALAAMANNALKGGVSGSALNTILTRMSGSNSTAAKQMEKMGLSMYYTVDAMGHAEGEAKALKIFLDELREAFKNFGDDAQAAQIAAYNLAGMRGMRGLLAIVNQSDEQWAKLTNEVYNYAGAADQISGIRMDNYTGQMYLLTSAWDALKTSVGEQFIPTATAALEVLTDITNGANEFVQNNGFVVRAIAAGTAALGGMLTVITALALGVQAFRFAMATLKITELMTLGTAFGWIVGIAAAAGLAIAAFTSNVDNGVESVKELTEAAREMGKTMEDAAETYEDTTASVLAAANVADHYIDKLEEMGDYASLSAEKQREYQNTLALLLQVMPELSNSISQTTDKYGRTTYTLETTTEALRKNTEAWKQNAMAQAYQDQLTAMYEGYSAVLIEAEKNSIGLTRAQYELEAAQQKQTDTIDRMNELWAEASEEANRQWQEYGILADATAFLTQEYYDLQNSLADVSDEIWTAEQNIRNHEKAIDKDKEAVEEARAEIELTEEAVRNLTDATEDGTRASAEAAEQEAKLLDVFAATEQGLESLTEAYTEAYEAAYDSFSGLFGLFEKVEEKQTTTMQEITDALSSQAAYFAEYRDNLAAVAEAAEQSGIDLSGVWSKLTDGSQESAAAVAAMAESVKNGDVGELEAYVDQFNDLQEKILSLSDLVAQEDEAVKDALAQAEKDIAEAVANTEASEEAYNAMEATIQGYLDDLNGSGNGVGRVNAAIAAAGAQWKSTIANMFTTSSAASVVTNALKGNYSTFYFYDGILINGRYRITNSPDRCGKLPVGQNVTGWVPAEDCGAAGGGNNGDSDEGGEAEGNASTGLSIDATIIRQNWNTDGKDMALDCGTFELDTVDCDGPPAEVTIKATSLPFDAQIRQTKKTKGWEKYNLSGIAAEMAAKNGMECMFLSTNDPFYERVEQYQMSDIAFLKKLCHDAGISLKATNKMLVLFDQPDYEAKPAVLTIRKDNGRVLPAAPEAHGAYGRSGDCEAYTSYHLSVGTADAQYQSCRVSYNDPATGKCIEGVAKIPDYKDSDENQQLEITAKVGSVAEAKKLAEKRLRLHNKYCRTAEFTMPGNPAAAAGVTVELKGWGAWDGTYIVKQAIHTVNADGYTTSISLRRALEGY